MSDILLTYATETWVLLNEAAPWVLLGFFVAALIKTFISDQFIAKHLGKNGATSVLKASALGVPLPLCSCGVVPAAAGLRRQGASKGATAAFMISTPETGADSMAVTWAMLDPLMTLLRPLAAFVTATVAGLAINALDRDDAPTKELLAEAIPEAIPARESSMLCTPGEDVPPPADPACGCSAGCGGQGSPSAQAPLSLRLREAFGQTFGEMLQDIGKWLLIGILLAGLISTFVPDDFFQSYLGNEWASLLIMLLAGIPLYICATASTPIAATMALKGLSPGAALVFLLAGPATNAATIAVATKILGKRATAIYVGCIALCALGMGWLVNRIYFTLGLSVSSWVRASESDHVTGLSIVSSVLLLALIARPLIWRTKGAAHAAGCGGGCGCGNAHLPPLGPLDSHDFRVK
ncbi:MAG: SO_0444 family Cu/Zn efflux transporter [Proteobacteria bacterium]|nr:SO_0444 family Cu/Zn efflux transporter [Pseudomonadota bacterium]